MLRILREARKVSLFVSTVVQDGKREAKLKKIQTLLLLESFPKSEFFLLEKREEASEKSISATGRMGIIRLTLSKNERRGIRKKDSSV